MPACQRRFREGTMTRSLVLILVLTGCAEHGKGGPPVTTIDAGDLSSVCPGQGNPQKIKFPRAEACGNDGGVEFCIPADIAETQTMLKAINPNIHCAPGGGRAGCLATPNKLLCSYPTAFPGQCLSEHGAMTDASWADMCKISAFPEIAEIIPTIFE
jgi:hypothetical protein